MTGQAAALHTSPPERTQGESETYYAKIGGTPGRFGRVPIEQWA